MKQKTLQKLGLVADLVELKRLKDIGKGIEKGNKLLAARLEADAERQEEESQRADFALRLAQLQADAEIKRERLERAEREHDRQVLQHALLAQREHELDVRYRQLCRQATKKAGEDGDYAAILKELVEDTCEDGLLERYKNHLAAAEALVAEEERAAREAAAEAALTPEQREERDRRARAEAEEASQRELAAREEAIAEMERQVNEARQAERHRRVVLSIIGATVVVALGVIVGTFVCRSKRSPDEPVAPASAASGASGEGMAEPLSPWRIALAVSLVVDSRKPDGRAWDAGDGKPDIEGTIKVGTTTLSIPLCSDTLTCEARFPSVTLTAGSEFDIEIVDRDIAASDSIGTGRMRWSLEPRLRKRLGAATMTIELTSR